MSSFQVELERASRRVTLGCAEGAPLAAAVRPPSGWQNASRSSNPGRFWPWPATSRLRCDLTCTSRSSVRRSAGVFACLPL